MLAGRKNTGTSTGAIHLNGFPKDPQSFARLTAYVEQQDIHSPFCTVGEAVAFSAALRLPPSVPSERRGRFCAEVEELLGIGKLRARLVGVVGAKEGLAPAERKILTIAVELVANAPVLFLDGALRPHWFDAASPCFLSPLLRRGMRRFRSVVLSTSECSFLAT